MFTIEYFDGNEWRFVEETAPIVWVAARVASRMVRYDRVEEKYLRIKDVDGTILC